MQNDKTPILTGAGADLHDFIKQLAERYQPEKLICFGHLAGNRTQQGCFIQAACETRHHYFILMVTDGTARDCHAVQDFANTHFNGGSITVIVHSKEAINASMTAGKSFFDTIYRNGALLFSSGGLFIPEQKLTVLDHQALAADARAFFERHRAMSDGFFSAAETCYADEQYLPCLFLLHQTIEQSCITLLRVFLGYRSEIHHTGRLLDLCSCFAPEAKAHFPQNTDEEKRLFKLLVCGYSDARYTRNFTVNRDDLKILLKQVSDFWDWSVGLCESKLQDIEN